MNKFIFPIGLCCSLMIFRAGHCGAEDVPDVVQWMNLRVDLAVERATVEEAILSLHEKAVDLGVREMGLKEVILQEPNDLNQHMISVSLQEVSLFQGFEILAAAGGSRLLVHEGSLVVRSPHALETASFPLSAPVKEALRIRGEGAQAVFGALSSFDIKFESLVVIDGRRNQGEGEVDPERFVITSTSREIEIIRSIIALSRRGIEVKPKFE